MAVAANSDRVYALIEAHNPDGGLYRSDDGGESWELVNPDHSLWQRPWYYMHVIADPRDENVLYIMNVESYKSTDGGHLFNKFTVPHGDNHGLVDRSAEYAAHDCVERWRSHGDAGRRQELDPAR